MRRLAFVAIIASALLAAPHSLRAAAERPAVAIPAGWPQSLVIPKIGVRAPVESLALTSPKDSKAPYRWGDVAWFDRGAKPGDLGRSVMYGHLDSYCCPAVFYHLRDLKTGDTLEVQYKKGFIRLKVMWQQTYPNSKVPWNWIFAQVHERGLSLITCTGVFHRDGTGYDHKLVVYARMILPNGKLA